MKQTDFVRFQIDVDETVLRIPNTYGEYPLVRVYGQTERGEQELHADVYFDRGAGEIVVQLAVPAREVLLVVVTP